VAVAATRAGHTAGALCGAGTGNQELKSTSYEGLTGRYIFQLYDPSLKSTTGRRKALFLVI
jgi:hypothetical protein